MEGGVPFEVILTAVGALLAGLGIPQLLKGWMGHREKQQDSAMGMLKFVLEQVMEADRTRGATVAEMSSKLADLVGTVEALTVMVQRMSTPPPTSDPRSGQGDVGSRIGDL